jgi:N-acetylmuramoyl-L-alanine amidase
MKHLLLLLFCVNLISCDRNLKIIDKPIEFTENRVNATLQYINDHYGIETNTPVIDPKIIVLHWTYIPTLDGAFSEFKNEDLNPDRTAISNASNLNVSSQFMVDRDGTIYRLMPENYMARHVIGLNYNAIGIENVGGDKNTPLTQEQVDANIKLVTYLKGKYDIEYVIGHYQYTLFEGHKLWLEKDDGYRTEKTDPGEDFVTKVFKATQHLGLKNLPE